MYGKNELPAFLIAVFPFFFVGMWCGVGFLLATMGGWRRLAAAFPAKDKPHGQRFSWRTGKVGMVNYSSCLTVHALPEGFYLSVLLPFRIGHPPLFIPWSEVRNAQPGRFLWFEWVKCDVGTPAIATLKLPRKIFATSAILLSSKSLSLRPRRDRVNRR